MKRKLLSIIALLCIAASMSAMEIYVKYQTTGTTVTLNVETTNTILEVKEIIVCHHHADTCLYDRDARRQSAARHHRGYQRQRKDLRAELHAGEWRGLLPAVG